jgi:hypothetical protein
MTIYEQGEETIHTVKIYKKRVDTDTRQSLLERKVQKDGEGYITGA